MRNNLLIWGMVLFAALSILFLGDGITGMVVSENGSTEFNARSAYMAMIMMFTSLTIFLSILQTRKLREKY